MSERLTEKTEEELLQLLECSEEPQRAVLLAELQRRTSAALVSVAKSVSELARQQERTATRARVLNVVLVAASIALALFAAAQVVVAVLDMIN